MPKRYPVSYTLLPAPVAPARPVDGTVTVPPRNQLIPCRVAWPGLAHTKGLRVEFRNTGPAPCEIFGIYADGAPHVLPPRGCLTLSIVEGNVELPVSLRSAAGTTVDVHVPKTRARQKLVEREPNIEMPFISKVFETDVLVPAP